MLLHSVLFSDSPSGANYERMARVLEYTAGMNSPATPLQLHRITEPDDDLIRALNCRPYQTDRRQGFLDNARKTKHHCRIVQEAEDGDILCLLDCDTIVIGDLSEATAFRGAYAAALDHDVFPEIVLTERPIGSAHPYNTGVVFTRVCGLTRSFFRGWLDYVIRMLVDLDFHARWETHFGGINQAAFAARDYDYPGANIVRVPCEIWNCEYECMKRELFSNQTKIVHVHGNLRRHLFDGEEPCNGQVRMLAERWREYEQAAIGAVA
jgi:hypothetical protein